MSQFDGGTEGLMVRFKAAVLQGASLISIRHVGQWPNSDEVLRINHLPAYYVN